MPLSINRCAELLDNRYSTAWVMVKKVKCVIERVESLSAIGVKSGEFLSLFFRRSRLTPSQQHPSSEEAEQPSADDREVESPGKCDKSAKSDGSPPWESAVDLSEEELLVLRLLSEQPLSFDVLVEKSGLSTSEIAIAVSLLELAGWIENLPGNRFALRHPNAAGGGGKRASSQSEKDQVSKFMDSMSGAANDPDLRMFEDDDEASREASREVSREARRQGATFESAGSSLRIESGSESGSASASVGAKPGSDSSCESAAESEPRPIEESFPSSPLSSVVEPGEGFEDGRDRKTDAQAAAASTEEKQFADGESLGGDSAAGGDVESTVGKTSGKQKRAEHELLARVVRGEAETSPDVRELVSRLTSSIAATSGGLSRKYLQLFLSLHSFLLDQEPDGELKLLDACLSSSYISRNDIVNYVTPRVVKLYWRPSPASSG